MNLFHLIEFEQDILSGIQANGEKISYADIIKKFKSNRNEINKENTLRLIAIIFSCFKLSKNELDYLIKEFDINELDKQILFNMQHLGLTYENNKEGENYLRRDIHIQSKEKIKEIKSKIKNKIEFNSTRIEPKFASIVEKCSRYELDKGEFNYVQEPVNPPNSRLKPKIFGNEDNQIIPLNNDDENSLSLIVLIIGGISHNEICAIERLAKERKVSHRIILGSTNIINAKEYLSQIKNITASTNINEALLKKEDTEVKEREVAIELSSNTK